MATNDSSRELDLTAEPACRPLRSAQRWRCLAAFAWRTRCAELAIAALALVIAVVFWESLRPPQHPVSSGLPAIVVPPEAPTASPQLPVSASRASDWLTWWNNLSSFLGFFTLLVALFVWVGELREDWQEALPNRMSACFFHGEHAAIVCRHVWLADASDLRAWAQQVAAQAAETARLEFNPDVRALPPEIVALPDGTACRHFAVKFQLTRLPLLLATSPGVCRYQNLLATDIRPSSQPMEAIERLPEVAQWKPAG